jgi:hypothetical protein
VSIMNPAACTLSVVGALGITVNRPLAAEGRLPAEHAAQGAVAGQIQAGIATDVLASLPIQSRRRVASSNVTPHWRGDWSRDRQAFEQRPRRSLARIRQGCAAGTRTRAHRPELTTVRSGDSSLDVAHRRACGQTDRRRSVAAFGVVGSGPDHRSDRDIKHTTAEGVRRSVAQRRLEQALRATK